MDKDIEIVGAGPASLIAAINLAKAGYKVTVYEEKPDVEHRFHGDFQGLENWSSKEDVTVLLERCGVYNKVYTDYICQPYNELIIFDANLNKTVLQSEKPFFHLVQRGNWLGCLDYGLMEQAMEVGVEIIFNKRVDKLERGGMMGGGMMEMGEHHMMMQDMMGVMKEMMQMMKGMSHTPTDAQKKRLDEMMKMHDEMHKKVMEKREELKKEKMEKGKEGEHSHWHN